MVQWNKYHSFLNVNPPYKFQKEISFNNKGYWISYEENDKSVIATQLLFEDVVSNDFKLVFDSLDIYTIPVR
jgi:hypothetical protein